MCGAGKVNSDALNMMFEHQCSALISSPAPPSEHCGGSRWSCLRRRQPKADRRSRAAIGSVPTLIKRGPAKAYRVAVRALATNKLKM
jgi:hypothetical protein